jgi:predicted PurR-regulated permease PerM
MGFTMPAQQTEQLIQAALQAPLNNLIVFGILIALLIVLGGGFIVWRFMPIILKQIQQLIDNNTQLTKLAERNADAAEKAQQTADTDAGELVKQTGLLTSTVTLLSDFKNFQKLNNDQVADIGTKVETLSKSVEQNTESIAESIEIIKRVETKIDELTLKHLDCIDLKADIAALRKLIEDRQTPTVSAVSNVSVDALPKAEDKAA